jgi:pterin-4a-carbinolamine dehydratase
MSSKKKVSLETALETGLKSERVQKEVAAAAKAAVAAPDAVQERLKSERVQKRLQRMPGWSLVHDGKALDRIREFRRQEDAVDFATLALRMASRDRYPALIHVDGRQVVLTLLSHPGQGVRSGITDNLLDLATSLG